MMILPARIGMRHFTLENPCFDNDPISIGFGVLLLSLTGMANNFFRFSWVRAIDTLRPLRERNTLMALRWLPPDVYDYTT